MTLTLSLLFLLLATFCFGFATFAGYRAYPWHGGLIAAGLFFLTLSFLSEQVKVAQ